MCMYDVCMYVCRDFAKLRMNLGMSENGIRYNGIPINGYKRHDW